MADEPTAEDQTGGPARAPRLFIARILPILLIGSVAVLVAVIAARLPSGTATGGLVLRAALGLGIGTLLIYTVRRMLRALGEPPPPPPQTIDATYAEVVYECPVCGTRVRLEVAATAKAPKHCGEEMEARIG